MKINKIRPDFHFSTKIEIKITYLVFVKIVDKVSLMLFKDIYN